MGSITIAILPHDLPSYERQAVKQHLDCHVGAELETSRVSIVEQLHCTSTCIVCMY